MLTFLTDPHIGLGARSNTSTRSSAALDAKLNQVTLDLIRGRGDVVLAGDLFHRSHNKENVIAQGIAIASMCDVVVGGNHDFTNRADDRSSMDIVNSVAGNVLMAKVGEVRIHSELSFDHGEVITVIPHHSSQDLFDAAVVEACDFKGDIVVLHCNFNNPFVDGMDTALNLTVEQANELLKHYDYIVIGHEHNYRTELGGRLIALGNTHPTSFSDISNKYIWEFNKGSGFTKKLIWDKEDNFLAVSASDIIAFDDDDFEEGGLQFLDIIGELAPEHMPELARKIGVIWDKVNPFMIRNNVNVSLEETSETMEEGTKIEDFTIMLRDGLKEAPELLEIFNLLVEEFDV